MEEKLKALKNILKFNSLVTFSFQDEKLITKDMINFVKNECQKLDDIYKFNFNCSDIDFLKQIHEFVNSALVK